MKSKKIKYYSYSRLRKITVPLRTSRTVKDSELSVVKVNHTFDTFDELVDYLDNSGTESELHVLMVSSEIPRRIRICAEGPDKLEKIYEHGTVFNNKWYSFELTGWAFCKQEKKVNKERRNKFYTIQ